MQADQYVNSNAPSRGLSGEPDHPLFDFVTDLTSMQSRGMRAS